MPLQDEDCWDAVDSPCGYVTFWDLWIRIVSDVNAAGPLGLGRQGAPLRSDAVLEAKLWRSRGNFEASSSFSRRESGENLLKSTRTKL